ncbi:MAG: DUF4183 domain-containing protein [Tissierellia bacterium]|nr:DUF4183 domain-containing protein [Tissierellia bacterium]
MAPKLFKLKIEAATTTTVTTHPEVTQYFYEVDDAHRIDDTLVIPSTAFVDGEGNAVVGNLETVAENNGYYSLFINGVEQQTSLYEVEEDGSQVTIDDATTILTGSPIILIVTNFDPDANSTTTVTT